MPKKIQFVVPGQFHFVHICNDKHRYPLFYSVFDYLNFKHIALEEMRVYNIDLVAYCLTPGHVLLLALSDNDIGLSQMLDAIQKTYQKKYAHLKHHLHMKHNYSAITYDFIKEVHRYIERFAIEKKLTFYPQHYLWSSCSHWLDIAKDPLISNSYSLKTNPNDWLLYINTPPSQQTHVRMKRFLSPLTAENGL